MTTTTKKAAAPMDLLIGALDGNGYTRTTDPGMPGHLSYVVDLGADGGTCVCFHCPCDCPRGEIKATCPPHGYCCFCYDSAGALVDCCCTSTKPTFSNIQS